MDTKNETRHVSYELPACPVEATLELIGGKWKGIILFYLLDGRTRFTDLKRKIGCVTQRMLTKQLRELEYNGLVKRTVYPEVPPKVVYELTENGQSLEEILRALKTWGEERALPLLEKQTLAVDE